MDGKSRLIRWLVPALPVLLGLSLFLGLLAQPWRTMMVVSDADALMWRRVGDWMLEHKQVPRADEFSHTRAGARYITKEWGANVVYAAAARVWGLYGMALVAAGLIALSFGLLLRQLLRDGSEPLMALVLSLVAVAVASMHYMARPHLFSFLFLVLAHDWIRRHNGRVLVLGLAGLTLLWVNFHGGFLMMFFLVGAYGLGALLGGDRRRFGQLALAGIVCAVVSLANPNGWALHRHTLEFLGSPYMTGWIVEFASPNFHEPGARGLLLWLALIFFTLALLRPRLSAGEMLVLAVWTYFALYSRRNTPLFVLVTTPILAPVLSAWVRARWRWQWQPPATQGGLAVVAVVAVAMAWPRPIALPAQDWPVAAVAWVQQQTGPAPTESPATVAALRGPVFNQYVWGSYLLAGLPAQKVFIDSRQDFYGESLLREFSAVTALRGDWRRILERYGVQWTLMPSDHRLNLALAALPGQWQRVYQDPVATIYVRAGAPSVTEVGR